MAVLSNNGRLISSLPVATSIQISDQLLIQSNGITKRINYAVLSQSMFNNLNPYSGLVNFTNIINKFTGSFNGNSTGVNITITAGDGLSGGGILTTNRSLAVDSTVVRTSGTQTIGGSKTFSSTILGNITSTGTSTFSSIDVNGGAVDGTTIGSSSPSSIVGTTITANTGFVGNLTGDVYNANANKVLENGSGTPTSNGGIPNAFFYGTSSYSSQALTAAYASSGGSIVNGLPSGGSQYQVLSKNSGTNYDAIWINPITASSVGQLNYIAVWNSARELKNLGNFYYNGGAWNITVPVNANTGINVTSGVTGSFKTNTDTVTVSSGNPYKIINGHQYGSVFLRLSASGYCTMSLTNGQTSTIFVQNTGNYKVLKWSGSLDGGVTANTKIYWKNGLSASITQGDQKKDVITFVNINNKIFGTTENNFQ